MISITTVHIHMQKLIRKTQIHRWLFCSGMNVLLTSDFGSSTLGERHNSYYANHPQYSAHLVVQSQFLNAMVGTQLLNAMVGPQLLNIIVGTQLLHTMVETQFPQSDFEADNATVSLLGMLFLRWGLLIWVLILLRNFCPHLGGFLFFFSHYVSAKFHLLPSSGD